MMALEWFAAVARNCRPGQAVVAVEDLKVLRGVVLEGAETSLRVDVVDHPEGLALTLAAPGARLDRIHYRAQVRTAAQPIPPPPPPSSEGLSGQPFPLTLAAAYRDWLFHGPAFRVINQIDSMGEHGLTAGLTASHPAQLLEGAPATWVADPALLDGVLQLVVLWLRARLGLASLPSSLRRLTIHEPPSPGEPVNCRVRMTRVTAAGGVADAWLLNSRGRALLTVEGAELTASANLNPMFTAAAGGVAPP